MSDGQGVPARGVWFRAAVAPARLVGRVRGDIAAAVESDPRTFAGRRRALFALLTIVAVGYPLAAAIAHAIGTPRGSEVEFLDYALAPYFDFLYLESLPFLIAVAGVGAFSPSLGVLLMVVFVPTDLAAAVYVSRDYLDVVGAPNQLHPLPWGLFGRLVSDAILWVLAVEIPLQARRWASSRQHPESPPGSPAAHAARFAIAFTVLVALWTYSALWLAQPAAIWLANGYTMLSPWLAAATWVYGWVAVVALVPLAIVAGLVHRAGTEDGRPLPAAADRPRGFGRQIAITGVLALMLSGLMHDALQAGLIIGGLLVAGPLLSAVLPRVQPTFLSRVPAAVRWAAGLALVLALALLALAATADATSNALLDDYLVFAILLAVTMPLFRLIVEAGPVIRVREVPVNLPVIAKTLIGLLVVGTSWLALPRPTFAHDPPEAGVSQVYPAASAALLGAAAVGAALAQSRGGGYGGQPKPKRPPLPNFDDKTIPGAQRGGFWQRFKDWFSSFFGGGSDSGGGNYTQGGAGAGGNPGTNG